MICTPKVGQTFGGAYFYVKKGKKFNTKYSPEFKISVIMDMRENHLSYSETVRKYDVKHNVISKWERIFLEEGAEGLMKRKTR